MDEWTLKDEIKQCSDPELLTTPESDAAMQLDNLKFRDFSCALLINMMVRILDLEAKVEKLEGGK